MARYTGVVEAAHGAEELWHYLADLRSVGEWDPSVEAVELVAGEPRTASARYRLEVGFRERSIELPYRTVEVDPPHRVVFEAQTGSVSVRDEAVIEPLGPATSRVTWKAEIRLRGIRRVLDLALRGPFRRLGEHARKGLRERLEQPELNRRIAGVEA
jgi:carbon monoxide dehydrogenase subunit G